MSNFRESLLAQLDAMPPFLAYALARTPGKRMHRPLLGELAKSAGMSERTFVRIARKFSWSTVKVGDVESFTKACNVDLLRQMGQRNYLRHTLAYKEPFVHLTAGQRKTFLAQCKRWKEMKEVTPLVAPDSQTPAT